MALAASMPMCWALHQQKLTTTLQLERSHKVHRQKLTMAVQGAVHHQSLTTVSQGAVHQQNLTMA
jgi:hypothetical protein